MKNRYYISPAVPGTIVDMEIKEHRLLLFIELYKELHGETLTASEAYEKATLLLEYVLMCLRPLAKIEEGDITIMSNESE